MQRAEALDLFPVGALSQTQTGRHRRLALATGFGCQAVWNRSTRRAGERGGARVGKPGWVRILRNADPVANRRTGLIIGCAKEEFVQLVNSVPNHTYTRFLHLSESASQQRRLADLLGYLVISM